MEPPIIPSFDIPSEAFIPVPAFELPTAEQLEFETIFRPRTVSPGSIRQLLKPKEEEEPPRQEPRKKKTEPSQEEPEIQQEPLIEDKSIDKLLREVQRYQIQSPRIDMLDGWPFEEEPIEPIVPAVPKTAAIEGVVTVQVLGVPLPMPAPEILVAAGATAGVSVAATLASTSILKKVTGIMKPIIKQIIARLQKKKFVKLSWARQRLVQRRRTLLNKDFQA